jgi:hypothetical protein
MNNSNTANIDDEGSHKENAIYANQTLLKTSIQQPSSSQSKRTLQIVVDQDVTPKKPSKSQVALTRRKRRVLCELTEAEIQARSIPRIENAIQAIDYDTTEQQSSEAQSQTAKSKSDSNSLFKAARQARQKQSISSHIGSQTITTSRGSASDKANSSLQKTHRNLR